MLWTYEITQSLSTQSSTLPSKDSVLYSMPPTMPTLEPFLISLPYSAATHNWPIQETDEIDNVAMLMRKQKPDILKKTPNGKELSVILFQRQ